MRGMILAAGSGTRMEPLTRRLAKPALPVLGVPLVVRAARLLRSAGITSAVVNLHHRGESIREALARAVADPRPGSLHGMSFRWSHEPVLLGTAGGVGKVREWLAAEGTTVVVNSDFVSDLDLGAAVAAHKASGALGTLVVVPPSGPFPGELHADTAGHITGFGKGGPGGGEPVGLFEFTGCHILEPELLGRFPETVSDSVRDVYPWALERGALRAHVHPGFWWEFGSLDRFLNGQLSLIPSGRFCEEGSIVETNDGGRAWLAPGADLSPRAIVRGVAVVGGAARVQAGAILENSVVLDEAVIPPSARVRRCLVGPRAVLTGGFQAEGLAIAPLPLSPPPASATAPETPFARPPAPPGCRIDGEWLVREIQAPAPIPARAGTAAPGTAAR